MGCFVKVKKYREPNTEDDLDSVDDLIKSSSESEGRPSSVEMISSEDEQDIDLDCIIILSAKGSEKF